MPAGASTDVIIIGSGHNGLVAACYLARAGLDVLVLEAARHIGGMTSTEALIPEAPRHLIDPCSVDHLTIRGSSVVADLNLGHYGYRTVDVDPAYVCVADDGASVAYWHDPRRTAEEIRRFSSRDAEAFLEFARLLDGLIDIGWPMALTNPVRPAPRNVLAALRGVGRHRGKLGELKRMVTSTAAEVAERFEHPLVQGPVAGYSFQDPEEPGSALPLLLFWGGYHRFGSGRPVGGSGSLPAALSRRLTEGGGQVRTSAPVEELLVDGRSVVGVRLATGETVRARAVLAACDPKQTLTRLLPPGVLSSRHAARAAGMSTSMMGSSFLKVDLALQGRVDASRLTAKRTDGLDMRTPVLFQGTLQQQCDAAKQAAAGLVPDFLAYMAVIPTSTSTMLAPAGQDTVYIYAWPMPTMPSAPWENVLERGAETVLKDVRNYYDGLDELELGRYVEAWPGCRSRTGATDGNWAHVNFKLSCAGPLRPAPRFAGYRTPVPGLFLTGAGTHPGPSVSGISGQLAARTLLRSFRDVRAARR